ncbi:unnamed protein product [Caretta caretta]
MQLVPLEKDRSSGSEAFPLQRPAVLRDRCPPAPREPPRGDEEKQHYSTHEPLALPVPRCTVYSPLSTKQQEQVTGSPSEPQNPLARAGHRYTIQEATLEEFSIQPKPGSITPSQGILAL